MDNATVKSYFTFNLGFPAADIVAAVQMVAEFRTQYNDEVRIYNASQATGFNESSLANFQARSAIVTSDALASAGSMLSAPAFKALRADIQRAKYKMFVSNDPPLTSSPTGCCYNTVQSDVLTAQTYSPPHVTLIHSLTVEGNWPGTMMSGAMHHGNVFIESGNHVATVSGPFVTPTSYISVSASVTLDSNTDPCLLDLTVPCTGNENAGVQCTQAGGLAYFAFSFEDEIAYTQAAWVGTPPPVCVGSGVNACVYRVQNTCTPATTPPDAPIGGITTGDYRGIATYISWVTASACIRFATSGPWICFPPLAQQNAMNNVPPLYPCTHNP